MRILFSFLTALAFGRSAGGREAGETTVEVELTVKLDDMELLVTTLGLVTITLSLDCGCGKTGTEAEGIDKGIGAGAAAREPRPWLLP